MVEPHNPICLANELLNVRGVRHVHLLPRSCWAISAGSSFPREQLWV